MFIRRLKNKVRMMTRSYSELRQQAIAAIILSYLLFVFSYVVQNPGINYYSWRYFMTGQPMISYTTLFIMSLCWQTWRGLSGTIRSSLRSSHLRSGLLALAAMLNLFYAAWGVSVLWDIYI